MAIKESAVKFLKLASGGDVPTAYDAFVAPNFIHHNVHFKGDRQSLLTAMEEAHAKRPNRSFEVKNVYQDGSIVITHSLVTRDAVSAEIAVVHIFRFDGPLIVELWDVGQPLPAGSPNENGPF